MANDASIRGHFDSLASRYDRSVEHRAGRTFPFIAEAFASVRPFGRILDVGCGPGHLTEYLHRSGHEMIGLDISPSMLEIARRNCPPQVELVCCSAYALPFPGESLDGIVFRFAAQHLRDRMSAFVEAHRVLRKGGVCVVSDTIAPANGMARDWQHTLEIERDPHHERLDTIGEWRSFLASAGFLLLHHSRFPYPQDFLSWADRVGLDQHMQQKLEVHFREAPPEAYKEFSIEMTAPIRWSWIQCGMHAVKAG